MAGDIIGTTVFSNLSVGGSSSTGVGYGALSVASSIAVVGGATLSKGGLDLKTNAVTLSLGTLANTSGRTTGQLTLVFAASGISLVYSSGKSEYIIGGSATSGAQG